MSARNVPFTEDAFANEAEHAFYEPEILASMLDGRMLVSCGPDLRIRTLSDPRGLLGKVPPERLAPLLSPAQQELFRAAALAEGPCPVEAEITVPAAGETGARQVRLRGLCRGLGDTRCFFLALTDVTAQFRMRQDLNNQMDQFRRVLNQIHDSVYLYEFETDTLQIFGTDYTNPLAQKETVEGFLALPTQGMEPYPKAYLSTLRSILLDGHDFEKTLVAFPGVDGDIQRKCVTAYTLLDDRGCRKSRLCLLEGRESLLKERESFSLRARVDQLTGLFNRLACEERVSDDLCNMDAEQRHYTMLFLDLDGFKAVNDRLGHAVGDRVLRAAARMIRASFRERDGVFRLGGDEFVVWADGQIPGPLLETKTQNLNRELQKMAVDLGAPPISVSVGIADAVPGDTFASLYQKVDAAMYEAKRSGKCRCCFYTPAPDPQTVLPGFPEGGA